MLDITSVLAKKCCNVFQENTPNFRPHLVSLNAGSQATGGAAFNRETVEDVQFFIFEVDVPMFFIYPLLHRLEMKFNQ